MKFESAEILIITFVPVVVLFLLFPFWIALRQLPGVWRLNRGTGGLLAVVIFLTVWAYGSLLGIFAALAIAGSQVV